jgi:hypothetical protein
MSCGAASGPSSFNETGKVRVVYAKKKLAASPIGCHVGSEGSALKKIAFPSASWLVMCLSMAGRFVGIGVAIVLGSDAVGSRIFRVGDDLLGISVSGGENEEERGQRVFELLFRLWSNEV